MYQQLTFAARCVVVPRSFCVLRDVNTAQPQLTITHMCISIDKRCTTCAQGFNLSAGENNSALIDILDRVIVARFLILRDEFTTDLFDHDLTLVLEPKP